MKTSHTHRKTLALLLLMLLSGAAYGQGSSGSSPHGSLALACSDCHTTEGWRPIKAAPAFSHQTTRFPLVGRHAQVQCTSCHTNLDFSKASSDCKGCHLDVHRGQFAYACSECHTPKQWSNQREMAQRHQQTRFPLTGLHATVDCEACHATGQYTGLSTECVSCHLQAYQSTTNPSHVASHFSSDCSQCHTVTKVQWSNAAFTNHAISGFPLTGQHAVIACAACHNVNGQSVYAGLPMDCYGCHQANFQAATDPNHVTGNFGHDCAVCHSTGGWNPASFNHNLSGFVLTGAHASVACAQCHTFNGQPRYTGTPTDCYSCHQSNFEGSTNPNHVSGNFPHDCSQCHTTSAWQPATFDHNLSSFPLTGAHVTLQCAQCHVNGQFANTPTACYSCHQSNFEGSTNPNHVSGNFPHDCSQCHTTSAWQPATFDHNLSSFPLTGAHVTLQCAQCHVNGQFANTPTDCYTCHTANYTGANNPDHAGQNYPHDCTICHNTAAWQPSTFDHATSPFPLTGRHASVTCAQCHVNGQFVGTPTACYACHQADYDGTRDPNHAAQGFSHDCSQCHNTNGWGDSGFLHANTGFPLSGAHATLLCNSCHANGHFANTPTDCYACHRDNFEGTSNPGHVQADFSRICSHCHTTTSWQPSTFSHNGTRFPLTGAHGPLSCQSCHRSGPFNRTSSDCYSCHQPNFDGVTNPNHVTNQFDHNCLTCHNTSVWNPSTFDHSTTTFPLTGAHVNTVCNLCHVNGQYQGLPTDCYSCHQANYENVTDPNHVTGQFDHNCLTCHSTTAWNPATFDHSNTTFPLTGQHVNVACNLCHINGQFQGTPTDCYFCHQADYNNASNPNHQGAHFPTTCVTCHTTSGWTPATFDHDGPYFPIYSGHHAGTWSTCDQCHTNASDYTVYTCLSCHEHDQSRMDNAHSEVSGYVYESTHCYTCHPRGNGGGRLLMHPTPRRSDK